jgi:protein-tyrosine phosphatase
MMAVEIVSLAECPHTCYGMNRMIDLHNHILPALDDGAADLDESLAIARQFVAEGVDRVAATPHVDPDRGIGVPAGEIARRVADLQAALARAGISLTVVPGHELYLTPEAPDFLRSGKVSPLAGGPFVLVEVSFTQTPIYLDDTLFRLGLAGYRPILAHPERYAFIQNDITRADALVGRDIILQLTAPSLLGEYGGLVRKTAERILRRGGYALAASDRHHPGPMRSLATLHERIAERFDPDLADLLLRQNPARVLDGRTPLAPEPLAYRRTSFLSRLFPSRS